MHVVSRSPPQECEQVAPILVTRGGWPTASWRHLASSRHDVSGSAVPDRTRMTTSAGIYPERTHTERWESTMTVALEVSQ